MEVHVLFEGHFLEQIILLKYVQDLKDFPPVVSAGKRLFSSAELCSDGPYVVVPLIPAGSRSSDVRWNKDASEVPSLLSFRGH